MKIGIDGRLWNETGVGRYIRNLVVELEKLDRENEYYLFLRKKDFEDVELPGKNWEKKLAEVAWHSVKEQWEIPKILGKENLDLVHFPYFDVPIFYRGPFVVTVHDLIISHFPTGRATTLPWPLYQGKRLGYKLALWRAISRAVKIITVSEATKKEIIDHFNVKPDKIVVTYESGELNFKKNHKSAIINHKFPKPYLLYVGNAHPHKNLERLLEAFQLVEGLKLVLVGRKDFFYQRLEKEAAKMDLTSKVVFFGEAIDGQLCGLYKNAAALVLPSLMEGFGLPALEAMSYRCLVLASDIPSYHEICASAAIYFNPLNVNEIARKMEEVCFNESSHWEKLLREGKARAKTFSWSKMARNTLKVYQEASVAS